MNHPMIVEIMQRGYPRESPFAWGYDDNQEEEKGEKEDDV